MTSSHKVRKHYIFTHTHYLDFKINNLDKGNAQIA
jgi:hypothetical protein